MVFFMVVLFGKVFFTPLCKYALFFEFIFITKIFNLALNQGFYIIFQNCNQLLCLYLMSKPNISTCPNVSKYFVLLRTFNIVSCSGSPGSPHAVSLELYHVSVFDKPSPLSLLLFEIEEGLASLTVYPLGCAINIIFDSNSDFQYSI